MALSLLLLLDPQTTLADNTCQSKIDDDYQASECGSGSDQASKCTTVVNSLKKHAEEYNAKIQSASSALVTAASVHSQNDSQDAAHAKAGEGAKAVKGLISLAEQLKGEAWSDGKGVPPDNTGSDVGQFNSMMGTFKSSIDSAKGVTNSTSSANKPGGLALSKASKLIKDLDLDETCRKSEAESFEAQGDTTGKNIKDAAAPDKGMDMASMAGLAAPLASLAAMAMSKSDTNTATGVSDPSTATAATEATTSGTALTPLTNATAQSSTPGNSTSTNVATQTNTAASTPANTGAVSSASKYPDAFTGAGSSGMGSYGGTSNAAGSGGAGSSAPTAERAAASLPTDQKVDEALASFGGGSLNNLSSSAVPKTDTPTPDQPVKDFLQDAESNVGNADVAANPPQTGLQGADALELFHRVHNTLERSQRKGQLLMGLGAQG